jgi:hypothetical protein
MGERTDDAGQIIGVLYGIQDELQMIRDLLTDIKKQGEKPREEDAE